MTPRARTAARLGAAAIVLLHASSLAAQGEPRAARSDAPPGWIGFFAGIEAATGSPGAGAAAVVVLAVAEGSPAARIGLAEGDTLVTVNGVPLTPAGLRALQLGLRAGDRLELVVKGGAGRRALSVRAGPRPPVPLGAPGPVEPLPDSWAATGRAMTPYIAGRDRVAGARMTPLNPGLAEYFGTARGLLVVEVVDATPAADAGLRPGDVVLRVGGVEIDGLEPFRRALAAAAGPRPIPVQLLRRGARLQVDLPR